jgi:transglutaminase-like putative cysteine protease
MKFQLGCQLDYSVSSTSTFIFNIRATENEYQQVIEESLQIEPDCQLEEYTEPHIDNRYFRIIAPEGKLAIVYRAKVELKHQTDNSTQIPEIPPTDIPLNIIPYLYPSRYCQSDRLMKLARDEFGDCQPGYARVEAICDWIYHKIDYISGSSNSQTSAYDTAAERVGVCRDFAHLGITFCRALDIPARFVSAYAWQLQPPDFHACFEAYLGDKWYLFDATRLAPLESLVRIGTGRDASDVAFATIFGEAQLENMQVYINSLDEKAVKNSERAIAF